MMHAKRILALSLLAAASAMAQTTIPPAVDPGAIQQRQMDEERRRREAEREQRKPVAEPLRRDGAELPATRPGAEAVRFRVREIRFTKSEILTADELESVAREFRDTDLSLADLNRIAARINALYRAKGIVTARAIVPAQDVTQGVVLIRLVEGRLGKVRLQGNDSTDEDYVADRLRLRPDDLMDLATLEAALVRFNRTNDAQLRAELKPGERFATTDLLLTMAEPARHDLRVSIDSLGSSATGKERTTLTYLNRSLFGYRDDFSLSHTGATGQRSLSASYGVPINTWGGRASFAYYADRTAIRNGLMASLRITGESTARVVSVRQPTYVTSAAQLDVIAGAKQRRSYNWIDSVLLQRTDTGDRSLGIEAQLFGPQSTWFASYGRAWGEATTTARDTYGIDRGSIRYNRRLPYNLSLRGSLGWQSTNKVLLPSSEQYFIGGEGSVRGYPVGVHSGDTGQTLNLEVHHPLLDPGPATDGLGVSGFFFADHGRVKPYRAPGSTLGSHEALTGLGWGALSSVGKNVYAKLTVGYGVTRVALQPRNYEVTLQVVASVF